MKAAYVSYDGDVERMISELKCCTLDDIERHCQTLQTMIDSRQLTHRKNFTRSAAQVRRRAAASRQVLFVLLFTDSITHRLTRAASDFYSLNYSDAV